MDRVDHFGRDLLVVLDREDRRPLRVQLEEQLRDGVRDGRLHAGTALPSTRALAAELGIARGVVVEAYGQLVAEGFLVARRGSATRVAKVAPAVGAAAATPIARIPSVRFDLRPESAERGAFPRGPWLAAVRRALAAAPDADLGYGSWAGAPGLRAVLAAYLGRARGVVAAARRHRRHRRHHPGHRPARAAPARARGAPRDRRGAGLLAAPHDPAASWARARSRRGGPRRPADRRAARGGGRARHPRAPVPDRRGARARAPCRAARLGHRPRRARDRGRLRR